MVTKRKYQRKRKLKTHYSRFKKHISGKNKKSVFLKIALYFVIFSTFFIAVLLMILYFKYIKDLPSTKQLQNLNIAESSIIYDKDNNELYKIFKEKRTYVEYENISHNMINALVAGEDKRYWTNPGVDLIGIIRAGLYYIIGKTEGGVKGTSTLTQQLIRNTIIKNERSIERKIKEIYLAYKLTSNLSKEKILELYLNKISFGHNAYGIEEAAKTFFNKQAKDLGILESAILASLPKGPTYYSPYNRPGRLLGYPYVYNKETPEEINKIITKKDTQTYQTELTLLKDFINNLKANRISNDKILICNLEKKYFKTPIKIDSDGCNIMQYSQLLNFLNSIRIESGDNYIEYQTGRKDFILQRMLEDTYIEFDKYKESVNTAIAFEFKKRKEKIDAPHFVFFVKEYLEEKYGKDIVSMGGLKIYTSIDSKLQKKAEELVEKYANANEKNFAAKNAALVSIDNRTGHILAMVGGKDYFDTENKGNVNIINSAIQPGSTFKPFVYSLAMKNAQIGSKTPVYDVKTNFPSGYSPSNFDAKFMGKMNTATALNNSRNIPAIKMFYMAGGESNVVNFMKSLGVESLKNHGQYGAPLSLGTGEMTPLELAGAYSVYANLGIKKDIIPVLKIVDSKGNIIEEHTENPGEQVMSSSQAYILNNILSDTSSRPSFWNNYLSLKGRSVAAKTGTSTKQYEKYGRKTIYPRNLWTIGYTPQVTTVAWAGNTDGTQLNSRGNGLEGAGPLWRDFMYAAHEGKSVQNWPRPAGVQQINISSISGKLPNPEGHGNNFLTSSLFLKGNTPTQVDNSYREVEVDLLCNGVVTEQTPKAAIGKGFYLQLNSLNPQNPQWEIPVQEWTKTDKFKEIYGNIPNLRTSIPTQSCERAGKNSTIHIGTTLQNDEVFTPGENTIELAYKSDVGVKNIQIFLNNSLSSEIPLNNKKSGSHITKIFVPRSLVGKTVELRIAIVDNQYYSSEITRTINILSEDSKAPEITITNPADSSINIYESDFFNFRALIVERSKMTVSLSIDGNNIANFNDTSNIKYEVNKENKLSVGKHILEIKATDKYNNSSSKKITIHVLEE